MATPRLITIPFSHYCDKARWALDVAGVAYVEEGHLPILHARPARRAGGRSVPILVVDGEVLPDSTDILAWADRQGGGVLIPAAPGARAEALALEDDFDVQLGPATRRWAYGQVLPRRELLRGAIGAGVPAWEARAIGLVLPLWCAALRRGLAITPDGVERSRQKIEQVFERVDGRLADGRRFLVGEAFSVADLTFAALAAPIIMPPEQPFGLPGPAAFDGDVRAQLEAWRARPAGQLALRLYRDHRRARPHPLVPAT